MTVASRSKRNNFSDMDRMIYSTKTPHEVPPHGTAGLGWSDDPTGLGSTNWNAGAGVDPSAPDGCMFPWFQVYLAVDQSVYPSNVRTEVRNIRALTTAGGAWTQVQFDSCSTGIGGDAFPEDFGAFGTTAHGTYDVRQETDGWWSCRLVTPGKNFHGWSNQWPRKAVPHGANGFVATTQMRLVKQDKTQPWDTTVRLTGNCGIDLYAGPTDASNGGVVGGLGQGRFCLLTPEWKTLCFSTLTESQLRANPPPI